jgi:hypothetical protein
MFFKLLLSQKTKRGRTLLQRRKEKGNSIVVFFMLHNIPQQVLARDQLHFGTRFVSITIKIYLLVELNDLLDLLK